MLIRLIIFVTIHYFIYPLCDTYPYMKELDKCSQLYMLLGILNIITKSRLSFLILITVPKMPNLSLTPLNPSCHPQHDIRDAVLKYAIALLNV